jgi:HEPN domain-containing protein
MHEGSIKNWLALANYDLVTARVVFKEERYLYVAFACQQSIEKVLKALYVKEKEKTPPYTHNLVRLSEELSISVKISPEDNRLLERLNSFYYHSRYAEGFEDVSRKLDIETASGLLLKTESFVTWLLSHI